MIRQDEGRMTHRGRSTEGRMTRQDGSTEGRMTHPTGEGRTVRQGRGGSLPSPDARRYPGKILPDSYGGVCVAVSGKEYHFPLEVLVPMPRIDGPEKVDVMFSPAGYPEVVCRKSQVHQVIYP